MGIPPAPRGARGGNAARLEEQDPDHHGPGPRTPLRGGGTPILPVDGGEDPDPPPDIDPRELFESPVVINEGFLSATEEPWIELYNRTDAAYDLSDHHVTNDPRDLTRVTLPAGTSVPARGFLVLTATELGLDLTPLVIDQVEENRFVALVAPGAEGILDAANFNPSYPGTTEARVPDGDWEFRDGADRTPGAANRVTLPYQVVINEIMYHPIDGDDGKEYVELHNPTGVDVDVSGWVFTSGISYTFEAGATIPAGGYIVVARDPARIRSIYGLGPYEVVGPVDEEATAAFGRLRDSGERITLKDSAGRTADTLRFHDGGEWPRWADGLGSSMELIDPLAESRVGQAWDASDDSAKAQVVEHSYVGRHGGGESELAIVLLTSGITLVDDISVRRTTNHVTNGTFDANAQGWIIEGTHVRSGRTTTSPIRGAGSLKIVATGRGDNKVNRIETPDFQNAGLTTLPTGQDLTITFKSRWVVGSPNLLTYGYEHAMARSHALGVPPDLGTPGRENSVTARLVARQGSADLGPVISGVSHRPLVPGDDEDVSVTARVQDPDGVGTVTLHWSLSDPSATMASIAMQPIGDGRYRATVPGQSLGTRVIFWIRATDAGAHGPVPAGRREPDPPLAAQPGEPGGARPPLRHLQARRGGHLGAVRGLPVLHERRRRGLPRRPGEPLERPDPGDVPLRHRPSLLRSLDQVRGEPVRPGLVGKHAGLPASDASFHEPLRKFNLDMHHGTGADARERISHYLLSKSQGSGGTPYSDSQELVRWQVNGRGVSTLERVWVPDVQYLSIWYPGDDDGPLYEMDDRFVIADAGNMTGNKDAELRYPLLSSRSDSNGANKENYRWFFGLRSNQGPDDYQPLIDLARLFDPAATTSAQFDARIFDEVNVEEFLRVWAVRYNTDDWDQWGGSRGKNCYLYRPPVSGRWELIAWDMELTYDGGAAFIIPTTPTQAFNPDWFTEAHRLLNRPAVKRMYYGILQEMVVGPDRWFHSSRVGPYMEKLTAMGMYSTDKGAPGGFIDQRAAALEARIRSVVYPQVRFTITTRGGSDFATTNLVEDFAGARPSRSPGSSWSRTESSSKPFRRSSRP